MKHKIYIYALLLVMIMPAGAFRLMADNEKEFNLGVNLRPAYVMPTHGFYNGWNAENKAVRAAGSLHLQFGFSYIGNSEKWKNYSSINQGIGLSLNTFFVHEMLGTPVAVYAYQNVPFVRLSDKISLNYEWNFGVSGGWKEYDMVIKSHLNAYINVGILMNYRLNRYWDLNFGPDYTHFSNGDTVFPNSGANTIGFRIGAIYHSNARTERIITPGIFVYEPAGDTFRDRITYDIMAYGAWRADRMYSDAGLKIINDKFAIAGIQFNPLYHFNPYLSAGPSIDLMYDRSANLEIIDSEGDQQPYSYPSFARQTAAGVSARCEIKMPIFAVNIGIGYNISYKGSDLQGLYGVFALKTFLSKSIYLNIGYRLSSVLYSHNMMFGIGWRFNHD